MVQVRLLTANPYAQNDWSWRTLATGAGAKNGRHPCVENRERNQDARAALSFILDAVGKGQITPGEGETLAVIVESQNQAIQAKEWESRLIELEKTAKKENGGRP
jgi:hypothetical protein